MSVEGVWKVEMRSPHGWDPIATAFLSKGRYLAASADHYTIGRYKDSGGALKVKARTIQYGEIRTVLGGKKAHLDLKMKGRIKEADRILATATSSGGGKFDLRMRLTRLGELD